MRELTNTNTKVRRLGYFPMLLTLVQERSLGAEVLITRFVALGKDNQQYLLNYANSTGDIVPTTQSYPSRSSSFHVPYAAKRYVDFAHEIGWLTQISGAYAITRVGRVLLTLPLTLAEKQNSNPFFLPLAQSLFFIYELWRKDGDILFTLIQQLGISPLALHRIQRDFRDAYYAHLSKRMQHAHTEYEHSELLQRRNDVKEWQKPIRYAEHIVPPRLHWLLDSNLVFISSSSKRECSLTPAGLEFKKHFSNLDVLMDKWLDTNFFKAVAHSLAIKIPSVTIWQSNPKEQDVLNFWLRVAFKKFQRSSIPKLPITQVALFLSICLLTEEGIAVDKQDIFQFLSKPIKFDADHVVETRLSGRENEAYLTLNPV